MNMSAYEQKRVQPVSMRPLATNRAVGAEAEIECRDSCGWAVVLQSGRSTSLDEAEVKVDRRGSRAR